MITSDRNFSRTDLILFFVLMTLSISSFLFPLGKTKRKPFFFQLCSVEQCSQKVSKNIVRVVRAQTSITFVEGYDKRKFIDRLEIEMKIFIILWRTEFWWPNSRKNPCRLLTKGDRVSVDQAWLTICFRFRRWNYVRKIIITFFHRKKKRTERNDFNR